MRRKLPLFIFMSFFLFVQVWAEDDGTDSLSCMKTNSVNYADKVSDSPMTSVEDVLTGRVAGVSVQKWSGSPGVQSLISIRNAGAFNEMTTPLVVVNGVAIFQDPTVYTNINPLSAISLEEIESVEILKDATATAIYGARGANGVILIKTKEGKDKDALFINMSGGVNFVGDNLVSPISGNTERYRVKSLYDKRNLLFPYDKIGYPSFVSDSLNNFYRESTNHQDRIYDIRPVQNSDLTLAGAGEFGFYRLNIGMMTDQGVKLDNSFKRYNVGLNTRYKITDRFDFDFYLSAVMADRERSFSNLFEPSYFPYSDDPEYFPALTFESDKGGLNDNSNKHILINSALNFTLSDNLKLRSLFGIVSNSYKSKLFTPSTLNNGVISAFSAAAKSQRLSNKTVATWDMSRGKRKNVTNFGFEYINSINELLDVKGERSGSGFSDFVKTVGSAYSKADVSGKSDKRTDALLSFFADTKVDLTNNFQMLATVRVDGSSAYKANRWGIFPALGARWKLVNKEDDKGLSYLALKANAGKSGFLSNIDNVYLGSMLSQGNYSDEEGPTAIYPYDEEINYPQTTQFDLGFDVKLGKKTTLVLDGFYKKTSDYLYMVNMPSFSGFDFKYANGFDVVNNGLELSLNSRLIDGWFSWNTNVTAAAAVKSEITALPANSGDTPLSYLQKSNSLTSIYAYEANGYYSADGSDIAGAGFGSTAFQPGTPKIVDKNGDGVISESDMVVIADRQPDLFGGISNLFTFGNLYLDTHLSFAIGGEVVNESQTERFADEQYMHSLFESEDASTNYYFMRTQGEGPNDLVIQGVSSIQDASFLRVEKVSLGYDFGKVNVAGMKFKGAKFFVTGTNLFVYSDYDGDPQENYNGINQFNLATTGTPRYKTIILGLRLKL